MIPLSSWIDTESTDTFFSDLENEYKLFGTKSKQTVNFSNIPKIPFPLTPSKKYIMIEKFKDELKDLENISNKIKELELLREQEINEIKNESKRKLIILDNEINKILEKLDVDLTTLRLKCKFFEKSYECNSNKKEKKLRILGKQKINEIKKFEKEAANNKDELLNH